MTGVVAERSETSVAHGLTDAPAHRPAPATGSSTTKLAKLRPRGTPDRGFRHLRARSAGR